jgi:hypothetical protein
VQAALIACHDPKCVNGVPPAVATLVSCPNPDCVRGVPPTAARLAAVVD